MLDLIKTIIYHKDSKLSYISNALDLLLQIEGELDFSLNSEVKTLKYFAQKRLDDCKYIEIVHDAVAEKKELLNDIEQINKDITEDDLANITHQIQIIKNQKILKLILNDLKTGLNELELEDFSSFTERINYAKSIVSKAFEKLATVDIEKYDNLFIIDPDMDIENQIEDDEEELSISTGFKSLDEKLLGFKSSKLVLFLGGTGKGKSIWLANCCYQLATNFKSSDYYQLFKNELTGYKPVVLFITNENTIAESRKRLLSVITNRSPHDPDFSSKKRQAEILKQFAKETGVIIVMHYMPPRSSTAFDVYSLSLQLERKYGYKPIGVIVDYLDRLTTLQKSKEERHTLGFITDELKSVAIKLNVPVISATQLNREGYKSSSPNITNVEESWKKVENADVVLVFNAEQSGENWSYSLIGQKVRYYKSFTEPLTFLRHESTLRIVEPDINNNSVTGVLTKTKPNSIFDNSLQMLI